MENLTFPLLVRTQLINRIVEEISWIQQFVQLTFTQIEIVVHDRGKAPWMEITASTA